MPLSKELLRILACPACDDRPPLRQENEESLVCDQCHRRYPIRDGIIDLLADEEAEQQQQAGGGDHAESGDCSRS